MWIIECHKLIQNLLKRGDGFPTDVDSFPHKVSSRNNSSRRRVFAGKGQHGGVAGITRKNEKVIQKRRATLYT
jgi:hypothetical protein